MDVMASVSLSIFVCLRSTCTISKWVQFLEFKCNKHKRSFLCQYTTVRLFMCIVLRTVILCCYCVVDVSCVLTLWTNSQLSVISYTHCPIHVTFEFYRLHSIQDCTWSPQTYTNRLWSRCNRIHISTRNWISPTVILSDFMCLNN